LSRRSPFPQGGDLPKKYYDVMDPFVTLAAAAAATTRLQVATGVCLVVQRDPIQTAKQVASLDQVSGGRFLFGIGAGWNAEEMADHGTEFKSRFKVMRERVEAMRAIWTKSKPEYTGEYVKFPPMMTWPSPCRKPHPPMIVAARSPTARAGDRLRRRLDAARAAAGVRRRARAAAGLPQAGRRGGRDPATPADHGLRRGEDGDLIKRYRDAGVARLVFNLPRRRRTRCCRSSTAARCSCALSAGPARLSGARRSYIVAAIRVAESNRFDERRCSNRARRLGNLP